MGYLLIHTLAKDPSKLSADGLNAELWVKNLALLSGMLYPKSFYLGPMFQYVLNQVWAEFFFFFFFVFFLLFSHLLFFFFSFFFFPVESRQFSRIMYLKEHLRKNDRFLSFLFLHPSPLLTLSFLGIECNLSMMPKSQIEASAGGPELKVWLNNSNGLFIDL